MIRCILSAVLFSSVAVAQQVDFATAIHPLLARCSPCHAGSAPRAGLSMANREALLAGGSSGPAIVPGRGAESLLVERVAGKHGAFMPPTGAKLTADQITTLTRWIDEGALWTDLTPRTETWTAALAPRTPAVPKGQYSNAVDAFLGEAVKETVADSVYVRRVYYDITGLPPTPAQLSEFQMDRQGGGRERLVDRLLADRRLYAGHWISFWNDLLRNDQGVNYAGTRQTITPWLMKALMDNMPYDRMVAALLNPAEKSDPEGFLLGVNWRGDINASQTPYMQAAQNSAQIFLGVNLKCASCHDSFINKYKLKQSYGMAALFSETSDLELVRCDLKTGVRTGPAFLFPELGAVPENASLAERRAAAARLFTSPENGRLARTMANRMWQRLTGRGLVEPVDEMDARPSDPDLLDWLASDFASHGYDLKHLIRQIMTSRAYRMPTTAKTDGPFQGPVPRRLTAEQFADTISALTGEWRLQQSDKEAHYVREWELKSTALSRAMGRPIRDTVFTTRNTDATMLQALELVNGETLETMLRRGARRLLGQLPAAPSPLFDSHTIKKGSVPFSVDISGVKQLWFLLEDVDSYDPLRTLAAWTDVRFSGTSGSKTLEELATLSKPKIAVPSTRIYNIEGLGFTKVTGKVGVDPESNTSEINPSVRFYIFGAEPDRHRLVAVTGGPPVAVPPAGDLITMLYRQGLSRDPTPRERQLSASILSPGGTATVDGLEDFLWSILMHPELQYIY